MRYTTLAAVRHGTAQFFFADFFVDHRLYHIRSGDKHMAFLLHHKDEIRQCRRVAGTSGAWTEDSRNLRDHAACHRVLVKDVGIARQAFDSFLDTCTARVVQCDDRRAILQSQLLYLDNLLGIRC